MATPPDTVAPTPPAAAGRVPVRERHWVVLSVLAVAVVAGVVLSAGMGAFSLSPATVAAGLVQQAGIDFGARLDATEQAVLWDIRLPRVALATLVGAALGCAGAVMQGVFRNPLAEPGAVGVSAGSALGAVLAIATAGSAIGTWAVPAGAFAGGLTTTVFVYRFARHGGRTDVVTLILTGIAVNSFAGAGIGLLSFFADDAALRSITFWSLGSMSAATWPVVAITLPLVAVGLVLTPRLARPLDLLALGERQAGHVGVDLDRTRALAIGVVAVMTAAAVAAAGIVGFVGLVVPHLVRLVVGPRHRTLLPASALGGAALVLYADLVARTAVDPAELPLGVLTALLGAPFFLWLIASMRMHVDGR